MYLDMLSIVVLNLCSKNRSKIGHDHTLSYLSCLLFGLSNYNSADLWSLFAISSNSGVSHYDFRTAVVSNVIYHWYQLILFCRFNSWAGLNVYSELLLATKVEIYSWSFLFLFLGIYRFWRKSLRDWNMFIKHYKIHFAIDSTDLLVFSHHPTLNHHDLPHRPLYLNSFYLSLLILYSYLID